MWKHDLPKTKLLFRRLRESIQSDVKSPQDFGTVAPIAVKLCKDRPNFWLPLGTDPNIRVLRNALASSGFSLQLSSSLCA